MTHCPHIAADATAESPTASSTTSTGFICGACGRALAGLPLAQGFRLPDALLGRALEHPRGPWRRDDFAWLPGGPFFVRCRLDVPIEGGDSFSFGPWVELSLIDLLRVLAAWTEPTAWRELVFVGRLANDLGCCLDSVVGTRVVVATCSMRERPLVRAAQDPSLQRLVERGWTRDGYRAFAGELAALDQVALERQLSVLIRD